MDDLCKLSLSDARYNFNRMHFKTFFWDGCILTSKRLLAMVQSFQKRGTLSTEQLTHGQSHHCGVAANKESDWVARDGRRWGPANSSARVSSTLSVILGNVI